MQTIQGRVTRQREQRAVRCYPAHDGQMIMRLKHAQNGRLTARCIRANGGGQQIEARFIHKNQGAPLQPSLFFISAQTSLRQRVMAPSSRWAARSTGIWGVHFNSFSTRATCDLWYATPNSHSMTFLTRGQVHTSPRKPYASAPWDSNSGIRCFSAEVSSGSRPLCGRERSAFSPCLSTTPNHWLTAPLVTPKAMAMSVGLQPLRFSLSACNRRCSFQPVDDGVVFDMPVL